MDEQHGSSLDGHANPIDNTSTAGADDGSSSLPKREPSAKIRQKKQPAKQRLTKAEIGNPGMEVDIPLNLSSIREQISVLKRLSKNYAPVFLLLLPLILAFFLRWYPMTLPFTDGLARESVDNALKLQVAAQVNAKYLNLPPQNRQALVDRELQRLKDEDKDGYAQAIQRASQAIKDEFKDEHGETYLGDIDTYLYYLRSERLLTTGHLGTKVVDGKDYDTSTLAPVGEDSPTDSNLHYYIVVYLHRLLHTINSHQTLRTTFAYVPILISMLAIFPAFFLGRRLGGDVGGFVSAVILAVHPVLIKRTMGGASDTDPYTVLFPLMILWLVVECRSHESRRNMVIFAAVAGLFTGLFSFAWDGWWYIFDFVVLGFVGQMAYTCISLIVKRQSVKAHLKSRQFLDLVLVFTVYLVSACIFVTLFSPEGFEDVKTAPLNPLQIFTLKETVKASLWPNVYAAVSELESVTSQSVIHDVGSILLLLSLVGLAWSVRPKEYKNIWFIPGSFIWYALLVFVFSRSLSPLIFAAMLTVPVLLGVILSFFSGYDVDGVTAFVLLLWYGGMFYAGSQGVRFILLMIPPFAVCLGLFASRFAHSFGRWLARNLSVGKRIATMCVFAILAVLLISPAYLGYQEASSYVPRPNDAWWSALGKVKVKAAPDAIITSWWDYGHWFKVMADRGVTFDGGNQNGPQAYWVGKLLLTWDETEAMGILRMLDCGSDQAYQLSDAQLHDTIKAVDLINELVKLNRRQAQQLLAAEGFDTELQEKILDYTHCIPPEAYLVTSEDMASKAESWSHFGGWDFRKAEMLQIKGKDQKTAVAFLMRELNMSESDALQANTLIRSFTSDQQDQWIAAKAIYDRTGFHACDRHNQTINCPIEGGMVILNTSVMDVTILRQSGTVLHPKSFAYFTPNVSVIKTYEKDISPDFAVGIVEIGNLTSAVTMRPELTGSMFTRLFLYVGYHVKYLTLFADTQDMQHQDILVWKADWDRYLSDIGDAVPRATADNRSSDVGKWK